MRRMWGLVAAMVCLPLWANAQSPGRAYSNCKYGYEVALPAGLSLTTLSDNGFEITVEEQEAGQVRLGKVRVLAMRDSGRFALWQQNGKLIWKYRVALDRGRARLADDWETVGGLLLLQWNAADHAPSGHMAHAQPVRPPELRYAALRRDDNGDPIVYTFTLTGAAAATPWMRDSVLRKLLAGFRVLPLEPGACSVRNLAATAGSIGDSRK